MHNELYVVCCNKHFGDVHYWCAVTNAACYIYYNHWTRSTQDTHNITIFRLIHFIEVILGKFEAADR
jgi:hypothetical protein